MYAADLLKDVTVLDSEFLEVLSNGLEAVVNIFFVCITAYRKI